MKQLQTRLQEQPFSFMNSGAGNQLLRQQTPAKQREMRDELVKLLQDLEEVHVEKSEHVLATQLNEKKLKDLRKQGGTGASTTNGFAFQQ